MIRTYKRSGLLERGIKDIRYRIWYAIRDSFPRYIPYILWIYLSCCINYALWDKHELEAYSSQQLSITGKQNTPELIHELKPFSLAEAAIAPAVVFFKNAESGPEIPLKRSLVFWAAVFSTGSLIFLLWLTGKLPLPAPQRPVAEYYGITPATLCGYQECFKETIDQLEVAGIFNEVDACCEKGVKIRTSIAEKFETQGGDYPSLLHLAVQQYLCADKMFRDIHRDEWVKTMMYENTSYESIIETKNSTKTMPYPPAGRVSKNLVLNLDVGPNKEYPI